MKFPFKVTRTASNHLPVWREFYQNKTLVNTVVGKISGNFLPLKSDLEILTSAKVTFAGRGRIKLPGDHYIIVKQYLESIGL